jgi:MFS family permease
MITIFIPIFLLKIGYGLTDVLGYFLIQAFAMIGAVFIAGHVDARFGFKHAILFSSPLFIIFFVLLYTLQSQQWPLALLAIVWALANAMFWVSYHTDFSRFSEKGKRNKQVGISKIMAGGSTILGPVVGGIIVTLFSFEALFILVSLLIIVSTIPLFFSRDTHQPIRFSIKELFTDFKPKEALGFLTHGFESSMLVEVWPIFVFLFVFTELALIGLAGTTIFFFFMLFVITISVIDDKWKGIVLKIGAILNGITWALKAFVQIPLHVFLLDTSHGSTRAMLSLPMDAITYDRAKEGNEIEYVMFREVNIHAGKALMMILLLGLVTFASPFGNPLAIGFMIAAVVSLVYLIY